MKIGSSDGEPSAKPEGAPHPFVRAPQQTLFAMSLPLVAEPLIGLVDTAFVSRLGSAELAAVGVGTQTDGAKALGRQEIRQANQMGTVARFLGLAIGILLIL